MDLQHPASKALPVNAVRRLHKGGVRPGEPLRTRVEAQEMLNKIPPSQRAHSLKWSVEISEVAFSR